jgi:hypothetical protein
VERTLVIAVTVAAHAITAVVPKMVTAEVFGPVVGDVEPDDRFDVKAFGMSAFGATDAFKAIGIRHDETPLLVLKKKGPHWAAPEG